MDGGEDKMRIKMRMRTSMEEDDSEGKDGDENDDK